MGRYLCDGECKAIQGRFHSYCEASPDNPGLAVAYRLIWKHRATNQLFVDPVPAGIGRLLATFPCVPDPVSNVPCACCKVRAVQETTLRLL